MSAIEISEVAFVSTSTTYRLCQKLNLAGLSELKLQVSMSISEYLKEDTSIDYNYPFKENETQNQITIKIKELYEQTLISTLNLIDTKQLKLISNVLNKSHHIDFYTLYILYFEIYSMIQTAHFHFFFSLKKRQSCLQSLFFQNVLVL